MPLLRKYQDCIIKSYEEIGFMLIHIEHLMEVKRIPVNSVSLIIINSLKIEFDRKTISGLD